MKKFILLALSLTLLFALSGLAQAGLSTDPLGFTELSSLV